MAVYKSSFVSFAGNYVLCCLLVAFLLLLFTELNFSFTFSPQTSIEFASSLFVLIAILILVILLDEPVLERMTRSYILTDEEVVLEEGIIRKKRLAIPLKNVADVSMEKGVLGRIFNFGDVTVKGMKTRIKIRGVKYPENVYEELKKKTNKALKGKG
jgi:uncharacterized membrane protein YdbT with pleckstrin-like domain